MNYLLGNENEFWNFIDKITEKDKIAVLTHTDLDGIASAIFLEQILEAKGINLNLIKFIKLKKNLFNEKIQELKDKNITKLFLTDINGDAFEDFENFRENFDVFLIDHHPITTNLINKKNIIKTETRDCSALTVYDLGKELIDLKKWNWLICAAIISDMAFKKKENLEFIQKYYSDVEEEHIFESVPGMFCQKITYALIYYRENLKKVYDLVKEKKLNELDKVYEKIKGEIEKYVEDFEINAEFYPERNLYFYYFKPEFNIASIVCTIISFKKHEKSFVFVSDFKKDNFVNVSARSQSGKEDMNLLLKNATKDLAEAVGGGHSKAAGGSFMRKDLEKFKKNILEKN